ncbi:MAG: hypothetical protein Tsb0021_01440 [Chlamydiales bacterium]
MRKKKRFYLLSEKIKTLTVIKFFNEKQIEATQMLEFEDEKANTPLQNAVNANLPLITEYLIEIRNSILELLDTFLKNPQLDLSRTNLEGKNILQISFEMEKAKDVQYLLKNFSDSFD